ncbi:MAG TPA: DUF4272 domain-containing protein [Blastocatellia bacterium]|nr:DUF4272 domain-containing protein [Blastocatellia bacterium]
MTDPEKRKRRSEELLKTQGIPLNPSLPAIESEEETVSRSAEDIAKRAVGLCAVALRGEGLKQQEVIDLLKGKDVWACATPEEKKFLLKKRPARQEMINFKWRYESLWVLLWALRRVKDLGAPISICNVQTAVRMVLEIPSEDLIQQAKSRPISEILDEADLIYRYDWAVVDARIKGEDSPGNLDPGVVYERHYALNWLIGYMGQEWDDVTIDT